MGIGRMCPQCNYVKLNDEFTKGKVLCDTCMGEGDKATKEFVGELQDFFKRKKYYNGMLLTSEEVENFVDSYTLTYTTVDETGKVLHVTVENQTKEETEIIYGNITDTIVQWIVKLDR